MSVSLRNDTNLKYFSAKNQRSEELRIKTSKVTSLVTNAESTDFKVFFSFLLVSFIALKLTSLFFSYIFRCDNWLAVDEGDGKIERVLSAADDNELTRAKNLFKDKSTFGLSDAHIWLSIIVRPQQSTFTRLQRLTCCLSWLAMTMVASILWLILIFLSAFFNILTERKNVFF